MIKPKVSTFAFNEMMDKELDDLVDFFNQNPDKIPDKILIDGKVSRKAVVMICIHSMHKRFVS